MLYQLNQVNQENFLGLMKKSFLKVDRMKFSADLEDTSTTKWYLNTILKQEGGETFKFSSDKKMNIL